MQRTVSYDPNRPRQKQASYEGPSTTTTTQARQRQTTPQNQFMRGLLRRRQISLDLLGPNDFFGVAPPSGEEETTMLEEGSDDRVPATLMEEEEPPKEEEQDLGTTVHDGKGVESLFFPLRFAPRQVVGSGGGGGHGGHGHDSGGACAKDSIAEQEELLKQYQETHKQVKADLVRLTTSLLGSGNDKQQMTSIPEETSRQLSELMSKLEGLDKDAADTTVSSTAASSNGAAIEVVDKDTASSQDVALTEEASDQDDPSIIRAGRSDKIKALVCFLVMLALTLVVTLWETHLNDDAFILTPVGLACVTDCAGNGTTRDFFKGHSHFDTKEVIELIINLDANEMAHQEEVMALVEIVGVESGRVKAAHAFGPPGKKERHHAQHKVLVGEDFDHPHEEHVINVYAISQETFLALEDGTGNHSSSSSSSEAGHERFLEEVEQDLPELSFTLLADVQQPLSDHSVIVAAVLMVFVYIFILLEVIHRTLIAIFGSMIALMFFFVMEGGHVESIRIIMLHLEWSTLGLLFGMMLIVGELSHTGVFEWCAVRILIFSKGSYVRLLVLLATLTAVASAFLDNVTTMLLVAPVTIDMCHILGNIDPRPYLIAEVLLSNVGGTATLIGDPPNIIIGSAFSDIIGFIDFIIHLMPVIFIFCIPATLLVVVYLYRWYLTSSKMRVLDTKQLKKTYQIYDEPRLLISGIVTAFVILMFFLHPVHHKDTAWIAILGALVTVS